MQLDADDDTNPYYKTAVPATSDAGKGSSGNVPVTEPADSATSQEGA
jgi:hypothetical protein